MKKDKFKSTEWFVVPIPRRGEKLETLDGLHYFVVRPQKGSDWSVVVVR